MSRCWVRVLARVLVYAALVGLGFLLRIFDPGAGDDRVHHFYSALVYMAVITLMSVAIPLPGSRGASDAPRGTQGQPP